MASKTLVVLTIILLILSLVVLGIALSQKVLPPTATAEGKVMAYVAGSSTNQAEPMSTTGKVMVNVLPNKTP